MKKFGTRSAVACAFTAIVVAGLATLPTSVRAANSTISAAQSGCSSLAKCFRTGGNQTATSDISNRVVSDSSGVLTINVGDTVTFDNSTGSSHDINFCTNGATSGSQTCADGALTKYSASGLFPDSSFGTGAPTKLTANGSSATFSAPGTYFYYCGISSHQSDGMWGKVVVQGSATTTSAPTTTVTPTTTVAGGASPTSTVASNPSSSISIKATRSGKSVIISGTTSQSLRGKTLTVQKKSGSKWKKVTTAKVTSSGSWSVKVTAATSASYRATCSSTTSKSVTK